MCPGNPEHFKKEKLKAKQTVLTFSSSNMFYVVQKILFTTKIRVRFGVMNYTVRISFSFAVKISSIFLMYLS